jgi:hypothetical protein
LNSRPLGYEPSRHSSTQPGIQRDVQSHGDSAGRWRVAGSRAEAILVVAFNDRGARSPSRVSLTVLPTPQSRQAVQQTVASHSSGVPSRDRP